MPQLQETNIYVCNTARATVANLCVVHHILKLQGEKKKKMFSCPQVPKFKSEWKRTHFASTSLCAV